MQELVKNISQYEAAETFVRPREVVGSKAFNIEQLPSVTDEEFREQVVSYLCEYRLSIPEFHYDLYYSQDGKGNQGLSDRPGGELIKHKAQRAVLERNMRKDPIHRELAEEQALSKLDQELAFAQEGDSVVWISPPGPKDEGYGDYGFVFHGTLDGQRRLGMRAVRIDGQTVEDANTFISDVLGEKVEKRDADEFLADPVVLPFTLHPILLHSKLREHFGFTPNKEDQEIAEQVIKDLKIPINEFVGMRNFVSSGEKIKALHALENYALERKEYYKNRRADFSTSLYKASDVYTERDLAGLMITHSHEPPKVAGSCGSTGSTSINSNNPLSFLSSLSEVLGSLSGVESMEEGCKCINKSDNHYHCPGCDRKYADETNKPSGQRTKECQCGFKFGC